MVGVFILVVVGSGVRVIVGVYIGLVVEAANTQQLVEKKQSLLIYCTIHRSTG